MNTKHVVLATLAVVLATATFAYAATYKSKVINESGVDVDIELWVLEILGLEIKLGLFHVLKNTVQTLLYTLTGLVAGVLNVTWKVKAIVGGVLKTVEFSARVGDSVKMVDVEGGKVCIYVHDILKACL